MGPNARDEYNNLIFPVRRALDAARFHQLKFIKIKCVAHSTAVSAVPPNAENRTEMAPRMPVAA